MVPEGIVLFRTTLQNLEAVGDKILSQRLSMRLRIRLADFLVNQHEHRQARTLLTQIDEFMKKREGVVIGIQREKALLELVMGNMILLSGDNRLSALKHYQEGLTLLSGCEDPWIISYALLRNAAGHDQFGNVRESGKCAERALSFQGSLGDPFLLWGIWANLGYSRMLLGEYEAAWPIVQEQIANLQQDIHRDNQAIIDEHLGLVLFYSGQYEQARRRSEAALTGFTRSENIACLNTSTITYSELKA